LARSATYDDFFGAFEGRTLVDLVVELDAKHQVRFDGLAWHELGGQPPEDIPQHVELLRARLEQRLPGYRPQLHVNEYSNEVQHLVPGWAVRYLVALSDAKVDAANRACWDVPQQRWSTCWAGLNGLFAADNRTPQPLYWVYRAAGDLVGEQQLVGSASEPHTVALGVSTDGGAKVLLGRAGSPGAAPLALRLEGLSPGRVAVSAEVIPPIGATRLDAPTPVTGCEALVSDGGVEVLLRDVAEGSAATLTVRAL
jgi:hypothetical protein